MTPELRKMIDKLIALDDEERRADAKKYPGGAALFDDAMMQDILNGEKSPVIAIVETLRREDVVYVTALAWFGRGDGVAEPGATFQSVLSYAEKQFNEGSVGYLCGMPLGKYLARGMQRLGIQ